MVGWHHRLYGHEFQQILGDREMTRKAGVLHAVCRNNSVFVHVCPMYYVGHIYVWASLVAQIVKNLPAMQETWV